jgi:broad specificity phosphatase PhoE
VNQTELERPVGLSGPRTGGHEDGDPESGAPDNSRGPGRGRRVRIDVEQLSKIGPVIVVGRHGKPALSRKIFLDAAGYEDWWEQYDAGGLAEGQRAPSRLTRVVAACKHVIASPLRRAVETARSAAPGRELEINDLFVEAPLPPPLFPTFIRLRPRSWGAVARLSWWLGFHREFESREEAEARAELAAGHLIAAAEQHGSVALLAHGWFNRMIRTVLLRRGFVCLRNGGDWHWSFRVYVRGR